MTVSTTPSWGKRLERALLALLLCLAATVHARSIEPLRAALTPAEDGGVVLSAEFAIDLGPRLEEAVSRGVPIYFNFEFDLNRRRWYWIDEHVAGRVQVHRLAYNALTRQYRLSSGALHQNFATLAEALQLLGRISAMPVAEKGALKPGETYSAAIRLSVDQTQLPKPFQVESIANRDWQVDARTLRWQFVAGEPK